MSLFPGLQSQYKFAHRKITIFSNLWYKSGYALKNGVNEFFVTNMGFPKQFSNGTISGMNENIKCLNEACTTHIWDEKALRDEETNSDYIMKNTILLPPEGYVIVRFRAENPGYWHIHCHNLLHNLEGMGLLFHIKDSKNNRPFSMIPKGLPDCANHIPDSVFPWDLQQPDTSEKIKLHSLLIAILFYVLT